MARCMIKPKEEVPAPAPEAPAEPTPMTRSASPEEQAQVQAQLAAQRGRAEVAVLKQRFAETDVAMTIAQAECDQLVRQNQLLQQENERLRGELSAATDDVETGKEDEPSKEPKDGQTTPAAAPKSEE